MTFINFSSISDHWIQEPYLTGQKKIYIKKEWLL